MKEPEAPTLLKSWRKRNGLTMRDAGARIVVDGKAADGATWHAWENGSIPKPAWMFEIERVTGVQPNQFYPRPDASAVQGGAPAQAAFL